VITGGAGFVGSHLCDRFLSNGWRVLAIDNLCTGKRPNVDHLADNPDFELMVHDVSVAMEISGEVDAVLHFASPASPFDYLELPLETMRAGTYGTFNALDLARDKGACFLMASTSEIYGDPLEHPQRESYLGNVSSIGPRSVYDEAKRFSEAATMSYHREFGLDTRIIRIFNTYGPRMNHDDGRVVPAFVCQALRGESLTVFGDGAQSRSFCYVEDLTAGVYAVLEAGDHMPYNLGNPAECTILEFAETIKRHVRAVEIVHKVLPQDDPKRRQPDISRVKQELGWQPTIPLHEGLRRTISWFATQHRAGLLERRTRRSAPK